MLPPQTDSPRLPTAVELDAFLDRVEDLSGALPLPRQSLRIAELARQWQQRGLHPGDIVLLSLPNSTALLAHTFGVLMAWGVPALLAPSTPPTRQQSLAEAFRARALLAVRPPALNGENLQIFELGGTQVSMLPASGPPAATPGEMVLLTSGTSGFSSGCVFDVEALLRNASRHADAIGLNSSDTVLVNLPLYFSYALVAQAFASLLRSARLVVSGPPFNVGSYHQMLSTCGVTVSSLTPVLVRMLLQGGHEFPSTLRVLTVGGDQLSPDHVARLLASRPGRELYLTYGLSEAGPRVATLAAHREPPHRFTSVGVPLPGTRVWVDTASKELFVSSDTVMKRRIGLIEGERARSLQAPGILATGDFFEMDDDGYLSFLGRRSDFLVRRGEKICVASVRRVASTLPGVLLARVTHLTDGDESDYDLTLTVLEGTTSPRDLEAGLMRLLRPGERPRQLHVVPVANGTPLLHK
ncbi:MAG: acyl--CoA ligase [Myxococcaceae bacterium]|nr:acyl--CoA ligase [Myxococcaceae bacterium]